LAVWPNQWIDEAFPKFSLKTGIIAATTSGRIGVVALLSK
jgi:hypothetical protein